MKSPRPPPLERHAVESAAPGYELLFELASGGMGSVHVGRRLGAGGFQRLVAIKRMHPAVAEDPESVAAFRDEARIASLVQHANVVAIHDIHEENDELLLVMDYIDGASLATLLSGLRSAKKRLSRALALRIVIDALRGLHAAHELVDRSGRSLELVHRDATPHNILIGIDGSVRLTDFGIARATARSVNTEPGFAKGKYTYMAPEHAFAEPLDRRADVFTMGVVAWEALTGLRLFANRTAKEVARGAALGEIPAPSAAGAGTPPDLDRIVLRALAPWREDRYETAAAFAEALQAFAVRDGGLAAPSAVAEVLDRVCGDEIRQRRERVRKLTVSLPDEPTRPIAPARPAPEVHGNAVPGTEQAPTSRQGPALGATPGAPGRDPRRIFTPATSSVDLSAPASGREPRVSRARLRRSAAIAFALAVTVLVTTLGVVLAGVGTQERVRLDQASRFGVRVTATVSRASALALSASQRAPAVDRPPVRLDPPRRPRK